MYRLPKSQFNIHTLPDSWLAYYLVVNFSMNEDEVQHIMAMDWVATASDGGAKLPGADRPHPRKYGTFPRKLAHYALRFNS